MSLHGYDPARVLLLRARTLGSIDALEAIRSSDPEASEAVRVARLARRTLEDTWLPAIDAIHHSTAMRTWRQEIGLGTVTGVRLLARLVDTFGARSTWMTTSPLAHLDDHRLRARLDTAVDALERAVLVGARPTDVVSARRTLATILVELLDRTAARPPRVPGPWTALDPAAMARLLDVAVRTAEVTGLGLVPAVDRRRPFEDPLVGVLALVGTGGAIGDPLRARLEHHAVASGAIADAVLRAPEVVDLRVIVTVAAAMVRQLGPEARGARLTPRALPTPARIDGLIRLIAGAPAGALDLVSDGSVAPVLATTPHLDADAVEALLASALGAPPADATAHRAQLEAWAGLVATTPAGALTPGASRGIARSVGPLLADLGVHLDRRRPVVLTAADGEPVRLGSYDDVARLLGDVLSDHAAQAALGLAIAVYRDEQLGAAVSALRTGPDRDPSRAAGVVGGHLADVTRVVELVVAARVDRDGLLALRHAAWQGTAHDLLGLVGIATSLGGLPAAPVARPLTTVAARSVAKAVDATSPARLPDVGLDADLAAGFTHAALGPPTHDPAVRRAVGLEHVSTERWAELDPLLTALAAEVDPDERAWLDGRIRAVVARDPDLDAYLETVRSISGEDRLG